MDTENIGRKRGYMDGPRLRCALCRGEINEGDYFYRLEGRAVCDSCLDRFARRHFSGERRRAGGKGAASRDLI